VKTALSPWGLVPSHSKGSPESWPGFKEGLFTIQDEASQLLGLMAGNPKAILDCCAGLGGKSLALATLFPEASIVAVDRDSMKLAALVKEAQRLGLKNPPVTSARDICSQDAAQGSFDLVLVDAPCSGLGAIRRRPDLKWSKEPSDPTRLSELQMTLLNSAAARTAPKGRLIYSVCTFTNEECQEIIKKFLENHPEFRPIGYANYPQNLRDMVVDSGQFMFWPKRHNTDGFFYAILEKINING
jgi:16S rRNA (cytosine967-C5)-methyltransferase